MVMSPLSEEEKKSNAEAQERIGQLLGKMAEDPSLMGRLAKRADLDEFKLKYWVTRASPLKCPACSGYGKSGGSLWYDPNRDPFYDWDNPPFLKFYKFTCRKCHLTFILGCDTVDTEELLDKLRLVNKGDEDAIHWYDSVRRGEEVDGNTEKLDETE